MALIDNNSEDIINTALINGWLTQNDLFLFDEFVFDIENSNFDVAITNFEKNAINLNLNQNEYAKMELAANTFSMLNSNSPEIFDNTTNSCCNWGCIIAVAALSISTIAIASF